MKPLKREASVRALSDVLLSKTITSNKTSNGTNNQRSKMFQHSTIEKLSPYATVNS